MKYVVMDPAGDQSISICKHLTNEDLLGIFLPGQGIDVRRNKYIKKYEVIAPKDLLEISKNRTLLPTGTDGTKACMEQFEAIKVGEVEFTKRCMEAYEKIPMLQIAKSSGLSVPTTYGSLAEVREYPVFYKPKFEQSGARGVLRSKKILPDEDRLLFQEYIDWPETVGVGFIAKEGEVLVHSTQVEKLSFPSTGGSAVLVDNEAVPKEPLSDTKQLLKDLQYTGWGLAEFKYNPKNGEYMFMELNAKFWASIEFALTHNPEFGKKLFGINIPQSDRNKMLFLDRLALRGNFFRTLARNLDADMVVYDKIQILMNLSR